MTQSLPGIIGRGALWLSSSAVLVKIIGIAYIVVVLRELSVYEYGVTELVITIPALLGFLSLPGLEAVLTADMSAARGRQDQARMRYLATSYLTIRMLLGVVACGGLMLAAPLVATYYNEAIATMIRLIALTFLFSPIRTLYLVFFKVALDFKSVALYRLVEELAKLLIVAVALWYWSLGPIGVVLAYVGTDVVTFLYFLPRFLRTKRRLVGAGYGSTGWSDPLCVLREHGKWGVFSTYLGMFSQNIRPWIIKLLLGTQAVGIYAVAHGMFQHTATLIPLSRVLAPIIPRYIDTKRRLFRLLHSAIKYQLVASLLSVGVMVLTLPILITYVFPDYSPAWELYLWLLPALLPSSLTSIYQPTFHALQAQRSLFNAAVVRLVLIVSILPLSIMSFGVAGIAFEFFITRSVYALDRYRQLRRLLPMYRFRLKALVTVTDTDRQLWQYVQRYIPYRKKANV